MRTEKKRMARPRRLTLMPNAKTGKLKGKAAVAVEAGPWRPKGKDKKEE